MVSMVCKSPHHGHPLIIALEQQPHYWQTDNQRIQLQTPQCKKYHGCNASGRVLPSGATEDPARTLSQYFAPTNCQKQTTHVCDKVTAKCNQPSVFPHSLDGCSTVHSTRCDVRAIAPSLPQHLVRLNAIYVGYRVIAAHTRPNDVKISQVRVLITDAFNESRKGRKGILHAHTYKPH